MYRLDVMDMEGIFLSLYQYALAKTVSDYVGKISIDEPLSYKVHYSDVESFHYLFENLLNELVGISYFFEGEDVRKELETTPLYPQIMVENWDSLFFIPLESIQTTQVELDLDYEEAFHRYFKGTQFKATIQNQGIYLGMAEESDIGNYLDQLNFIIKVLKESEDITWQESH